MVGGTADTFEDWTAGLEIFFLSACDHDQEDHQLADVAWALRETPPK